MNYNKYIDRPVNIYQEASRYDGFISNNIIQHPFIDTLPMDINSLNGSNFSNNLVKYKVILYRIRHHNIHHYVEFYLPSINSNETIFNIEYHSTNESEEKPISNTTLITYLKEHIQYIPGVKRFKGHIMQNNIVYSIVQIRDKNSTDISNNGKHIQSYYNTNNWLTIWDIIAYKHVFREKIDSNIVDLFIKHHTIAHLFLNKQICLLPMTLYCSVSNKYTTFINKHKSVQYCQRENSPIVFLNCDYLCESNNVRNVCFIPDADIYTTIEKLQNRSCIILNNDNRLDNLFKDDSNILSYIK